MADSLYEHPQIVAVYGTLRKNGTNNGVLSRAKATFLGEFWTPRQFCMYDYGGYPAVTLEGKESIFVEVYRVERLRPLDQLEGYPDLYERKQFPTPFGDAWIYWMHKNRIDLLCPQIKSGDWISYDFKRGYI